MPRSKAFKRLLESTKRSYLMKEVPARFRKRYGKRYNLKETKGIAYAIVKTDGLSIHRR